MPLIKYSKTDNLDTIIKSGKTVIDFYADWCGPCKMLAPIYEELSKEITDVNFLKIDVDKFKDLSTKYKVSSIPALILIDKSEVKKNNVGFMTKDQLKNFILD
ncbi:thioredoxin [Spiroplasma endosymbiont of Amphibalanus improvisus]|uniref:thioredoxin n=1 Tax=Spiroplasma endosymbiont of Amphibalanus improvisus TaxID=3066327 RepID=UPI00313E86DF